MVATATGAPLRLSHVHGLRSTLPEAVSYNWAVLHQDAIQPLRPAASASIVTSHGVVFGCAQCVERPVQTTGRTELGSIETIGRTASLQELDRSPFAKAPSMRVTFRSPA